MLETSLYLHDGLALVISYVSDATSSLVQIK